MIWNSSSISNCQILCGLMLLGTNTQSPGLGKKVGSAAKCSCHKDDLKSLKPQDLSNIVWAFTTVIISGQELSSDLRQIGRKIGFEPIRDSQNVEWALFYSIYDHPSTKESIYFHPITHSDIIGH